LDAGLAPAIGGRPEGLRAWGRIFCGVAHSSAAFFVRVPRLDELSKHLDELRVAGLLRLPVEIADLPRDGELVACTNDYLGLAQSAVSRETLSSVPPGAGASRLIYGTHSPHLELERALAAWVRKPRALLFSSGYAANVGVLQSLCDPGSVIVSDALNHASLIDGCRLSGATVRVVRHRDLDEIEHSLTSNLHVPARWVIVESYYSMDGDTPDLPALRRLCDTYQAYLVVDEAHALGVFGPTGAGLCAAAGVQPDVLIGTLGKAVGASGAFAAGSDALYRWLWNRARTFVFSTAPSPIVSSIARCHVQHAIAADGSRSHLHAQAQRLRTLLLDGGLDLPTSNHGPIFPILFGDEAHTLQAAAELRRTGIVVQPIRPPTVPPGSARLRVTINARMSDDDIDRLGRALVRVCRS
jgi:8-amino-7-oxononanoate synthase